MKPVISIEKLSKAYRIGLKEEIPDTFVGAMTGCLKAPLRSFQRLRRLDTSANSQQASEKLGRSLGNSQLSTQDDVVWALRDVSFEVTQGEVVGIIGRNGAGKSTLLKILSRITEPTSGRAVIRGRVCSLLEVGTGFHPELTGRENVYMNGTILGMTKREIDRKFDEIVEFSGVERFLDTPIKRYSSGMQVRLAFAVAAHLEPEILIVDEVLAVGDAAFQQKCLGKMRDVASGGRTVLFVSHNMHAVAALTTRCAVFADGCATYIGDSKQAVQRHLGAARISHEEGVYTSTVPPTENHVSSCRILTSHPRGVHYWGQPLTIDFVLHIAHAADTLCFSFNIVDELGRNACHFWLLDQDVAFRHKPGRYLTRLTIPKLRLYMGNYSLSTWLTDRRGNSLYERLVDICPFEVTMLSNPRPEYDWNAGECAYLEEGLWQHHEL